MRERVGQILKVVCLVLAALLSYQLVQVGRRANPLARVTIPPLPSLASDTNVTAGAPVSGPVLSTTNAPRNEAGTNSIASKRQGEKGTNLVSGDLEKSGGTNNVGPLLASTGATVNLPTSTLSASTNTQLLATSGQETERDETNSLSTATATVRGSANAQTASATNDLPTAVNTNASPAVSGAETNVALPGPLTGTNVSSLGTNDSLTANFVGTNDLAGTAASNSVSLSKSKGTNVAAGSQMAMAGMNLNPSQMRGGGRPAELPAAIKARVDRIYESELFGPVIRPMPMALQGIAGNSAFLRSPSGQTGLVKEGDSLGEIKLVRIGINRVLVEQDGKKTELMIFGGYGGESLMPKDKETSK